MTIDQWPWLAGATNDALVAELWGSFTDGWNPTPSEFYERMDNPGLKTRKNIKDAIKQLATEQKIVFGYHQETNTWRAAAHNQRDVARQLLTYGAQHAGEESKTFEMQAHAANGAGLITDTLYKDIRSGSTAYLEMIEKILNEFGYRSPLEDQE